MQTAIIIVAYNRPHSLARLLNLLTEANYPHTGIPLIISIDHGNNTEVQRIAESFDWQHGKKEIIQHSKNLGLRKHILHCGDLSLRYGSIILLEDDLVVSPAFYQYAQKTLWQYATETRIGGLALYSYRITESSLSPFAPLPQHNAYLMQLPCSWGQAWTAQQWQSFKDWLADWQGDFQHIPTYMQYWSAHSWKKIFAEYLLQTERYFLYPTPAFSSNPGEAGTNYHSKTNYYEVPLSPSCEDLQLPPFGECIRYDANFEMESSFLPHLDANILQSHISLDLYGSKTPEEIPTEYVITSQKHRRGILYFSKEQTPIELNILQPKTGKGLVLCRVVDMRFGWIFRLQNRWRPYYYTRSKFWNKIRLWRNR